MKHWIEITFFLGRGFNKSGWFTATLSYWIQRYRLRRRSCFVVIDSFWFYHYGRRSSNWRVRQRALGHRCSLVACGGSIVDQLAVDSCIADAARKWRIGSWSTGSQCKSVGYPTKVDGRSRDGQCTIGRVKSVNVKVIHNKTDLGSVSSSRNLWTRKNNYFLCVCLNRIILSLIKLTTCHWPSLSLVGPSEETSPPGDVLKTNAPSSRERESLLVWSSLAM